MNRAAARPHRRHLLGLALAVATAYLVQVLPHAHDVIGHAAESHQGHEAPAGHAHGPGDHDHHQDHPAAGGHHHDLAQHLDDHSLRAVPREAAPAADRVLPVAAVACSAPIRGDEDPGGGHRLPPADLLPLPPGPVLRAVPARAPPA